VENEHVYRVGPAGILVHNACPTPKELFEGGGAGAAKSGPKTDPTAPHNARIKAEADALEADGHEILAGGRRKPEKAIPTPGGHKDSRRPDILYKTPDGTVKGRNVGKTKADGTPVTREQKAMEDLN
jgi:hypothetical protein